MLLKLLKLLQPAYAEDMRNKIKALDQRLQEYLPKKNDQGEIIAGSGTESETDFGNIPVSDFYKPPTEGKVRDRYTNIYSAEACMNELLKNSGLTYFNGGLIEIDNKKYIATQCPIPNSFDDFWKVVWINNVEKIVMFTNMFEAVN